MSRSAVYCVLIREGEQRWFAEVWGSLRRELLWGPEAFETWVTAGEEIDPDPEDVSGAAIVDFDTKTLFWGEREELTPPRASSLYRRMLEHVWQDFSISNLSSSELAAGLHALLDDGEEQVVLDDEDQDWEERPTTVSEAAEYFYPAPLDDEEDEDEYEPEEPFSEDQPGVWVTIVDKQGTPTHRGLSVVPVDLLSGEISAVQDLKHLATVELPDEKFVTEGLWIHFGEQTIGYWGAEAESIVKRLQSGWPNWQVDRAKNGYLDQCQVISVPGKPMSDAEALGRFLPQILSNERMSMVNLFGAIGGSIKKKAIKATGCLTMVLSMPILLAGLFMGKWKEAGYALLTLVVIVVVIFKVIEFKLKSKFKQSEFAEKDKLSEHQRPPVAGPMDEASRKQTMGAILAACGLPGLAEIEPHFENPERVF